MIYTIKHPMRGHEPKLETFGVGRRVHTALICSCDWHAGVPLPRSKAEGELNRKYQDHLVDVVEARMA